MSYVYQDMILEDTNCSPSDSIMVENIMREEIFHSTLDWQTREQFREGAEQAFERLQEDRDLYEARHFAGRERFYAAKRAAGEEIEPSPPDRDEFGSPAIDYAENERTCVARLMLLNHEGEHRYYVAPAQDGRWFAWGEWHGRRENIENRITVVSETADDAEYDFASGGDYFPTRREAMTALYRHLQSDMTAALDQEEAGVI